MKNYFTVILRDTNGVRQFTFHKRVKHAAGILSAAGVLLIGATIVSLLQLKADLETQSRQLQKTIERQHSELETAKTQMDAIELAMGLQAEEQAPLRYRIQRIRTDAEARARVLELIPNGSPVPYNGISSRFGYREHPITHLRELHKGTDLKASIDTPVRATADGVVEFAGSQDTKGYGRLVILDHAYGFRSYYGHLHRIRVKSGQVLKKGDLIGYSGSSGLSNGPHLHYEVRFVQRPLNPYWFIKWDMANYDTIFAKINKVSWQPILQAITEEVAAPKTLVTKAAL